MGGCVGEGCAYEVANGEDRRLGRAQLVIDLDVAVLVEADGGEVQTQVFAVGNPANGEQDFGVGLGKALAVAVL